MSGSYFAHGARGPKGKIIMADDNHAQDTEKLKTQQLDRELQRRGVKIDDAIKGITDDDRRLLINKSLRKVNSTLSVG